jgi:acyl-coenzyme A thioesterase PaaI-like protein
MSTGSSTTSSVASSPSSMATEIDVDTFTTLDLSGLGLTHHAIHGENGLAGEEKIKDYTLRVSKDKTKLVATATLGGQVCGGPKIIHGGVLGLLLDDTMGTLFVASGRSGFTASLNISYKKPVVRGTAVSIEVSIANVEESKSRPGAEKVTFFGKIVEATPAEGTEPVVFTEATALFITKERPGMALPPQTT